jgi:hypothetical protein
MEMTILPLAAVNSRRLMRRQLTTAGVFQRQLTAATCVLRCTVLFTIQPLFLHSFNTYSTSFSIIQPLFPSFIQPIFSTFFPYKNPHILTFPHILSSLLSFPLYFFTLSSTKCLFVIVQYSKKLNQNLFIGYIFK